VPPVRRSAADRARAVAGPGRIGRCRGQRTARAGFFEVLALSSAGIVTNKTVFEAAGINAKTAEAYEGLLKNLLVVDGLPAWWSNRLKRLVQVPKRYVTDPGLIGASLRVDVRAVLRDGDLLGRVLDTFVVAQLRADIPVSTSRPRLYHLRQQGGRHEVDVLVELGGGRVKLSVLETDRKGPVDEGLRLSAGCRGLEVLYRAARRVSDL
jgi:predicted AAA+ superfamily ATPase